MRIHRLVPLCIVTLCTAAQSQEAVPSSTLAELQSPDWRERANAYAQLKGDQQNLQSPAVKAALLNLLKRENGVIHKTLADSDGKVGVSEKYGEEYSEYYSGVLDTVEKTADWHDQRELCVLAESAYNPDSRFAARLAAEGGVAVVPCLLKMAQGTMYDRFEAVPVLVQISGITKNLSFKLQQQIEQAVKAALQDQDLRLVTIEALDKFGNSDVIPILQDISRSDTYSRDLLDGTRSYDIKEAAAKAIQSIQARANTK